MVQTPNSTSQSPTHHASPLRHAPASSWSSLDSPPAWDQAQSTTQSDPATPDNIFFGTGGVEGGEPIMADDTLTNLLLGKGDYMAQSEVLLSGDNTSPIKYAAPGRHDPLGSMSLDQALNAGSPITAYFYEQQQQQPQVQVQPVHQHSPSPPPMSHAQVQAAAAAVHVHQPSAGMQHHQHHHHQTGARLPPLLPQQQQQPPQRHMSVQDGGAAWNRVYSLPLGSYHHEQQQQQQQQQQQLGKTMQRAASTSHILSPEYGRGGNPAYTPAAAFMHIQSRASMGMQANCSPYALPQHQHQQSTPYLTSGGLPPQSPMLKGSMISNTASHGGSVSAPYARPSGPMNPNSARGGNKNQFDFITEQQIREYANGSAGAGNGGAASEGASASQGNYPSNAEAFGLAQLLGRSPTYVESYDWTGHAALTGAPAMAGHDGAVPNAAAARAQSRSSTSTPSLVEASPRFNQGLATASPASEHPYGAFPMFQDYATAAAARPNELVHTHGSPTGTSHASPSALYQPELLPKVSTSTNANNNKTTQKRYGKGTAKGARANQRSISSPNMGEADDISLFRDTPDTTCKLLDDIVPLHIRVSNLPKDKRLMFERACGDRWNQDGTSHVSPIDELRNRNVLEAMFALIGSDALANQREIPDDLVRPILERVLLPKQAASKKGSRGGAEGYQCLWHGCGKGLIKRLDHAKNHVREHCGSKPHVCGSSAGAGCGQQFLRVDDLKRHQKTHCSVLRSGPGRRPRAIRGVRRGEEYEGADSDDSNSAAGGDDDEWRPSFNRIHLPQSAGGSRGAAAAAATAAESSTSSNGGNRSRGTQRRTAAATSFSVHFSSDEEDSGSEHDFGRLQTSNVRRMDSANGGRADQPFGLVDEQQQQHYHAQALRRGSTHAEERGLEDGFAE